MENSAKIANAAFATERNLIVSPDGIGEKGYLKQYFAPDPARCFYKYEERNGVR
jgi:hypothetical protein